jgi:hypothetical protein
LGVGGGGDATFASLQGAATFRRLPSPPREGSRMRQSVASAIRPLLPGAGEPASGGPQGNPNYQLYQLAGQEYGASGSSTCNSSLGNAVDSACIFHDVTLGDIDADCQGSYNCYRPSGTYGVLSTRIAPMLRPTRRRRGGISPPASVPSTCTIWLRTGAAPRLHRLCKSRRRSTLRLRGYWAAHSRRPRSPIPSAPRLAASITRYPGFRTGSPLPRRPAPSLPERR